MTHSFEKDYWEQHWEHTHDAAPNGENAPNPYLVRETAGMAPGTALDAGCGTGAEAIWLAQQGWQVTGADISATALAQASADAASASVSDRVTWIEADLTIWEPDHQVDLVTTHYAHPTIPHLAFYARISRWVAPGGTLLIVGHLHGPASTEDGHHPPEETTVTLSSMTGLLDPNTWRIETADEQTRDVTGSGGHTHALNDVIVRATRRPNRNAAEAQG
ncbi:MAG: class I SAM-dependent methyltransferase [Leifsonia flava]